MTILTLNAFKTFEGNLSVPLLERMELAREPVQVALTVGTGIIQVPSMFLPESTGDEYIIVDELHLAGGRRLSHGIV